MLKTFYELWSFDSRFWYVFFADHENAFCNGSAGPCLAVVDNFGDLVPTDF